MLKKLAAAALAGACLASTGASAQTPNVWDQVPLAFDEVNVLDHTADGYRVYQPAVQSPITAPLIAILHGGTTTPAWADSSEQAMLILLARTGYNVVEMTYCDWDIYCADVPAWKGRAVDTLEAAVSALQNTDVAPQYVGNELRWSILAYSMGAVVAPYMAMHAAERGIANPKAIVTHEAAGVVLDEGLFRAVYAAEHDFPPNWWLWPILGGSAAAQAEVNAAVQEVKQYWTAHGWGSELTVANELPLDAATLSGLSPDIEYTSIVGDQGVWSQPGIPLFGIPADWTAEALWDGTAHLSARRAFMVPTFTEAGVEYVSNHTAPLTSGAFATDLLDWHGYWPNSVGCLDLAHTRLFGFVCGSTWVTPVVSLGVPAFAQ